jgi:CheY-like chemotaxis protein
MARPTIAVVNDDPAFLELMQDLLTDESYSTILLHEGSGAYDAIRQKRPELVILDLRLEHPEAGWKTLELVRLDPETTGIPVIVCSADTRALRDKEDWLRDRDVKILEKPFNLDDLLSMVRDAIGSPAAADG